MAENDSKKLILARRARFIAATLAGVAASTTPLVVGVEACGGETEEQSPQPCLSMDAAIDRDAQPQPCLSVDADVSDPEDAGDGAVDDGGAKGDADAEPQPCLAPRP